MKINTFYLQNLLPKFITSGACGTREKFIATFLELEKSLLPGNIPPTRPDFLTVTSFTTDREEVLP